MGFISLEMQETVIGYRKLGLKVFREQRTDQAKSNL